MRKVPTSSKRGLQAQRPPFQLAFQIHEITLVRGAGSSVRGIICPLVWIGLTDLPNSRGALVPSAPHPSLAKPQLLNLFLMGFSLLGPLCAASHLTPTRASDLRKGRPLLKVSLGYLYVFMERPCCSSTILLLLALMLLFLSFCEMVLLNENRYSKIKLMTQGPHCIKVAFFQKVWFVFQISQFQKEKYSKFLSWAWNLNFLPITVNNKFKFQAQDKGQLILKCLFGVTVSTKKKQQR